MSQWAKSWWLLAGVEQLIPNYMAWAWMYVMRGGSGKKLQPKIQMRSSRMYSEGIAWAKQCWWQRGKQNGILPCKNTGNVLHLQTILAVGCQPSFSAVPPWQCPGGCHCLSSVWSVVGPLPDWEGVSRQEGWFWGEGGCFFIQLLTFHPVIFHSVRWKPWKEAFLAKQSYRLIIRNESLLLLLQRGMRPCQQWHGSLRVSDSSPFVRLNIASLLWAVKMMGGMQLKDPHRQLLRGTKLPTVWQKMPIFCKVRTLHRSESQRPAEPLELLQRRSSSPCPCAEEKQVTALGMPCSPWMGRWAAPWGGVRQCHPEGCRCVAVGEQRWYREVLSSKLEVSARHKINVPWLDWLISLKAGSDIKLAYIARARKKPSYPWHAENSPESWSCSEQL